MHNDWYKNTQTMELLEFIESYINIDGSHHKQWVIVEIVKKILGDDFDEWCEIFEYKYGYPVDKGITP